MCKSGRRRYERNNLDKGQERRRDREEQERKLPLGSVGREMLRIKYKKDEERQ